MAITIDWTTKIISIPKADTQLVSIGPPEIRQLNIDDFRLTLKDLEDDEEGMPFIHTHSHNPPVTVGGVTLARVVEIINGYTLTFEDGQYAVNLVGANSNIADVTNVNQVSIRSANSAGLTFSEIINDQSFNGYVWINTIDGLPGQGFPRGTPTDPVDNYADGHEIALTRKLKSFRIFGTITPTFAIARYVISADNSLLGTITLNGVADNKNAHFEKLTVDGAMNGPATFSECQMNIVSGFQGSMKECLIGAEVQVDPLASGVIRLISCFSDVTGTSRPVLDLNGCPCDVSIRDYHGGLTIREFTGGGSMSIDCSTATIEVEDTCTAGVIVIRGTAEVIDNSGPGCTVTTRGTVVDIVESSSTNIISHVWASS